MKKRKLFLPLIACVLFQGLTTIVINQTPQKVVETQAAQHIQNYESYYYSGSYYSTIEGQNLSEGLNGTLRTTLGKLIFPKAFYSYSGTSSGTLAEIFKTADKDPNNNGNMIYLYTRDSVKNTASTWNREHVWPQSLSGGNWGKGQAGTDCLHIRPTYSSTNSRRGNLKYGEASSDVTYNGMKYGQADKNYFEPLDSVKGDVARIIMYTWVTYKDYYSNLPNITNVFSSYDTMMEWHLLDQPDLLEGNRNDAVEVSKQKNRNPFVDHPEYAWKIFGSNCSPSVLNKAKETYPAGGSSEEIPLTSLSLNKNEVNLDKGTSTSLSLSFTPTNATYKDVTWSTSDASVVSVNNGTIQGLKKGSATITVKSVRYPNIFDTVNVNVIEKEDIDPVIERIVVSNYKNNFLVGDQFVFDGTVTAVYSDGTQKVVEPTSISSIDMTTEGDKEVIITYNQFQATIIIHVSSISRQLLRIEVENPEFSIVSEEEFTFKGTVYAIYSDGSKEVVTDYNVKLNKTGENEYMLIISYKENGITRTSSFNVSKTRKGCSSSIVSSSIIISSLSLATFFLIAVKKKRNFMR